MQNYWNKRYSNGLTSGDGSIGCLKDFKWSVIEKYVGDISNKSVIDVGCGDLSFWEGHECDDYTGIDISDVIIEQNKEKRQKWKFLNTSSSFFHPNLTADVVICFVVLFHIMDDFEYEFTLKNISRYSNDWIFIYTWKTNPFEDSVFMNSYNKNLLVNGKFFSYLLHNLKIRNDNDGVYQRYRDFSKYRYIITKELFLSMGIHFDVLCDEYGVLYVFKKLKTS